MSRRVRAEVLKVLFELAEKQGLSQTNKAKLLYFLEGTPEPKDIARSEAAAWFGEKKLLQPTEQKKLVREAKRFLESISFLG